jgi:hypothetical protein
MQQQEVMTASINPGVLLIQIADQIIKSKKKTAPRISVPVVTAKPSGNGNCKRPLIREHGRKMGI